MQLTKESLLSYGKAFFYLLFPRVCLLCDDFSDELVCPACLKVHKATADITTHDMTGFECVSTLYLYSDSLRKILHALKFGHYQKLETVFFDLLSDHKLPPTVDCVVPIPSTPARLNARGFNPVDTIFKQWVQSQGVPYLEGCLDRQQNHAPLFSKGRQDRFELLSDAFSVQPSCLEGYLNVLLVDDILTSGATVSAARDSLLSAGARSVSALCFSKS